MSTQPKALALADKLNSLCVAEFAWATLNDAANELRRLHAALEASEASDAESLRLYRAARERADKLHALNAQMLEALQNMVALANPGDVYTIKQARAAIDAAKGQA